MATRLDILNFWLREVDKIRQANTIIALYNAASSGVKDALFNAFKADCVSVLTERDSRADEQSVATQTALNEANAVT